MHSVVDQSIKTRRDEDLAEIVAEHEVLLGKLAPADVVVDVTEDQVDASDLPPIAFGVIKPPHDTSGTCSAGVDPLDLRLITKTLTGKRLGIELDPGDLGKHHFSRNRFTEPTRIPEVCAIPSTIRLPGITA